MPDPTPRTPPDHPAGSPANLPTQAGAGSSGQVDPPFVWPPRRDPSKALPARVEGAEPDELEGTQQATPSRTPAVLTRPWWRQIEDAWLDVRVPPLRERLAEASWSPDLPTRYCWRCGSAQASGLPEIGAPLPGVDDRGCTTCRDVALPWDRAVRLGRYEGVLKQVIRDVKFSAWRRLGTDLGRLLGSQIAHAIRHELRTGSLPPALLGSSGTARRIIEIVPVPTSRWHRVQRGIDHTMVLSRGAAHALRDAGFDARVSARLTRSHRPPQTDVRASERERNVAGSMRVRAGRVGRLLAIRNGAPAPGLVIVIDDVRTTGATMRAACRALRSWLSGSAPGSSRARTAQTEPTAAACLHCVWIATAAVAERAEWDTPEGG